MKTNAMPQFGEMTAKEYREMKQKKRSKYGNKKIEYRGMVFDSLKEYQHYVVLAFMQKAGMIRNLKHHVEYELIEKGPGVRRTVYEADFTYDELQDNKSWLFVVDDVKSPPTRKNPVYRIKKKLMRVKYGIVIRES